LLKWELNCSYPVVKSDVNGCGLSATATEVEVEVEVNLRPTVSRPVRLGIGPPYGTIDQILSCSFFLLTIT
jgi:hypothetical protein